MSKDHRLVYSTDPELNKRCPRCKELASECSCRPDVDVSKATFKAKLRMEKKGRGGKIVTVVAGLPRSEKFIGDLAAKLKKGCGVGGTSYIEGDEGIVEIQGDNRDRIRQILTKEKISFVG
jgi:translation initiation factor 1